MVVRYGYSSSGFNIQLSNSHGYLPENGEIVLNWVRYRRYSSISSRSALLIFTITLSIR